MSSFPVGHGLVPSFGAGRLRWRPGHQACFIVARLEQVPLAVGGPGKSVLEQTLRDRYKKLDGGGRTASCSLVRYLRIVVTPE